MNIYVGNLAPEATEQELQQLFEKHGTVSKASIIKDKFSNSPRGFAFVEMPNQAEAKTAIERLNGTDLKGNSITVNEAKPRTDRPQRPSGGGRRY
jgi:cold-inducible RNA-binding protein